MTNKNDESGTYKVTVKMADGTVLMRYCRDKLEAKFWVNTAVKIRPNGIHSVLTTDFDGRNRYLSIDPAKVVYAEYRKVDWKTLPIDCSNIGCGNCRECPADDDPKYDWIIIDSLLCRGCDNYD